MLVAMLWGKKESIMFQRMMIMFTDKTYQNSESIEKTAIENCSNSLLKYGDNGWLIQQQKSVSDGQIYALMKLKV